MSEGHGGGGHGEVRHHSSGGGGGESKVSRHVRAAADFMWENGGGIALDAATKPIEDLFTGGSKSGGGHH